MKLNKTLRECSTIKSGIKAPAIIENSYKILFHLTRQNNVEEYCGQMLGIKGHLAHIYDKQLMDHLVRGGMFQDQSHYQIFEKHAEDDENHYNWIGLERQQKELKNQRKGWVWIFDPIKEKKPIRALFFDVGNVRLDGGTAGEFKFGWAGNTKNIITLISDVERDSAARNNKNVLCQFEEPCLLDHDRGDGEETENRYYYDHTSRNCVIFPYNGYNGNANNFHSMEECISFCIGPVQSSSTTSITTTTVTQTVMTKRSRIITREELRDECKRTTRKEVGHLKTADGKDRMFQNKVWYKGICYYRKALQNQTSFHKIKVNLAQYCGQMLGIQGHLAHILDKELIDTLISDRMFEDQYDIQKNNFKYRHWIGLERMQFIQGLGYGWMWIYDPWYRKPMPAYLPRSEHQNFGLGGRSGARSYGNAGVFAYGMVRDEKERLAHTALYFFRDVAYDDPTTNAMNVLCQFEEPCMLDDYIGNKINTSYVRFYYNRHTKKCIGFTFDGFNGNSNNFESLDECVKFCLEFDTTTKRIKTTSTVSISTTKKIHS